MADARNPEPFVVTHVSGLRFSARIRSHTLIVDQTLKGGGEDSAPTPIELLGASLGSCIAFYVHQFFLARQLPTDGLRVEVAQHGAKNPARISSFDVRVILPDNVPPRERELVERLIAACPAHNTLRYGAEVSVAVEAAVLEMEQAAPA